MMAVLPQGCEELANSPYLELVEAGLDTVTNLSDEDLTILIEVFPDT